MKSDAECFCVSAEEAAVFFSHRFDVISDEGIDLFGGAADVFGGIEGAVEVDGAEGGVGLEPLDEVIGSAFAFDLFGGGLAVGADDFVEFLSVASRLNTGHKDFFRGHKGEFGVEVSGNDFGVDDESVGDVAIEDEAGIGGEEGLWEGESADGAVVERAFEPLGGEGVVDAGLLAGDEACERAHAFAPHGVAFVGHGGGADLGFFEGFFDFLLVLEDPDVVSGFVAGLSDPIEEAHDLRIGFAGVGLSGDSVSGGEAHAFGDHAVELFDFGMITVEEGEEGGLGAGGAFCSAEAE